ncbi:MAG TPA: T9SS type A sorting domain-containing protein [Verrucomicrobiae bacterium]|nr:T9SS type A sorting domain-containing protein [Verrucomicrobiae bacterium]
MKPLPPAKAGSPAALLFALLFLFFIASPAQFASPILNPAVQKPNEMKIDSTDQPGQLVSATISITNDRPVGLLYMRVSYDQNFLTFQSVTPAPRNVSWTFFDFDGGAPPGEIYITGIADTSFPLQPDSGPVAYLNFFVSNQPPPGTFIPICFLFQDSTDNTMYDSDQNWIDTAQIEYTCGGITLITTGIEDNDKNRPQGFELGQNYPNPFNASTSFTLSMPKSGRYLVRIYNLTGQVVKTFEGEAPAGKQILTWDGTDQKGATVSSGIYFYKAEAGKSVSIKRMMLIK